MQEYRFLFIRLSLYLIAGILLAFWVSLRLEILLFILALFLLVYLFGFYRARKQIFQDQFIGVFSFFMILLLGYAITYFRLPENQPKHYNLVAENENFILKAEIAEELKPTKFADRYILKTQQLLNKKTSKNIQGKLLLNVQTDSSFSALFKPGDQLFINWQPEQLVDPLNPYQFNYKKYLQNLQVVQQITVNNGTLKVVGQRQNLFAFAQNLRSSLIKDLQKYDFGNDELAVFQALVLGEKRGISTELYQSYATAGAIHILAISGLHIGILLLFLNFLFKPLPAKGIARFLKPLLIIMLLWIFALLTGFNPSVVRAVCMFSFLAVGMHLKRKTSVLNSLFLSLFFLLLINPYYLFQVGFQLSYLAVFSIIMVQPHLYRLLNIRIKILDYFWKLISVSISAQLGVLPLSIFYFHQFPGLFLASNLVILPFLGLLLGIGILIIILSTFNFLPEVLVDLYNFLLGQMNTFIEKISSTESFIVSDIPLSRLQLLACYIVFTAFIILLKKISFKTVQNLLISLLLLQVSTIYAKVSIPKKEAIIFNFSKKSLITEKNENTLMVYTESDTQANFKDYIRERRIDNISKKKIPDYALFGDQLVLLVDTAEVFPKVKIRPDLVLLRNSPKINFERFLDSIRPKMIVADASNYPYLIKKWQETSAQKKIPFHYTSEKGSFTIYKND